MQLRRTVVGMLLLVVSGCGTPTGAIPSSGAPAARAKLEGPRISVAAGSFKPTFFYGPWQCSQRWMSYCEKQCASEGYVLKGCMWIADLKMDWEGSLYDVGGRYAITHCCCDYPVLSKEATKQARNQWEKARDSIRKDWGKKFGDWPEGEDAAWPGHHLRDLKHGGDPVDRNNILPTPLTVHDILNKEYPKCYDGLPPWNTSGPDLPYSDN